MKQNWTFIFFLVAIFLLLSCNRKDASGEKSGVTIQQIDPAMIQARPDKGFVITYRWYTGSVIEHDSVMIRIVDGKGEVVLIDDHNLPEEFSGTEGAIEYTRIITLPVWEVRDNRTFKAILPEGSYKILGGMFNKNTGKPIELEKGKGVKIEGDTMYLIGNLKLENDAEVPGPGKASLDLSDYHLTFSEEFQDLSVSPWGPCGEGGTRWIAHTPWDGDFGDAEFVDPEQGFPFSIEDGILRIEVRKINGEWKSGLLSAADPEGRGFDQRLGYFECRVKFPEGPGTWPAFWLMGKKNLEQATEPTINPEIDIVEHYGHWPNRFSYVLHLWGRGGAESVHKGKRIKVFGVEDDFHTYGVLIDEDYMILYFDGVEKDRMEVPEEVKVPLYPIVNLALGPGWPTDKTPDPCYMYVDYIRVYSK